MIQSRILSFKSIFQLESSVILSFMKDRDKTVIHSGYSRAKARARRMPLVYFWLVAKRLSLKSITTSKLVLNYSLKLLFRQIL